MHGNPPQDREEALEVIALPLGDLWASPIFCGPADGPLSRRVLRRNGGVRHVGELTIAFVANQ